MSSNATRCHSQQAMKVYGWNIPDNKGLTNLDISEYARKLGIENFRGVFMRATLPRVVHHKESGIVNFNTSHHPGSRWVCYFKNGMKRRIFFDSFGQTTVESQKYLKTEKEYETGKAVIQRNTYIVQHVNTLVCGYLCLFVLTSLTREYQSYQDVLNQLNPEEGFCSTISQVYRNV